jgi:DeoR/GlpR family transcriptional regulator of sugar metabolism
VDHTKFGKVALHQLATLQDFDLVVVDARIDETRVNELRECSVPYEIVSL